MLPDKITMQVSIPLDDDGYFDRECPSKHCLATFKIHVDDWKNLVRDEEVFCPICAHTATSDKWQTTQQSEHFKGLMMEKVMPMIHGEFHRMAQDFNRKTRGGFLKATMKVNPLKKVKVIPLSASELMRQR